MSNKIRSNIKIIANLLKDEKILTVEEMLRGSFKRHKLQHNRNLWAKADPSMEMIKWTKFMRAKEIFEAFKRENKLMPYATDAYLKMNPCPPKSIRRTQRRRRRRRQLRWKACMISLLSSLSVWLCWLHEINRSWFMSWSRHCERWCCTKLNITQIIFSFMNTLHNPISTAIRNKQ